MASKSVVKTRAAADVAGIVQAKGFFKRAPTVVGIRLSTCEADRLKEDKTRDKNWKRWGPYLSERQWATVREDYSPDGSWCVCTTCHASLTLSLPLAGSTFLMTMHDPVHIDGVKMG